MLIRTRLASADISLEARVPTKDRPDATLEYLSFQLLPDDGDHLDLDTGEVFQKDYDEKRHIGASLTIRPSPDDSRESHMRYLGKVQGDDYRYPSSIDFAAFIEPTAFRELVDNIKVGLFPETITFDFENQVQFYTIVYQDGTREQKKALEYGLPDQLVWHNREQENQRVPISSVTFKYAVLKARFGQNFRLLPRPVIAPADRIINQTALIQTGLAEMQKYLRLILAIIVVLTICVAAYTLFHK